MLARPSLVCGVRGAEAGSGLGGSACAAHSGAARPAAADSVRGRRVIMSFPCSGAAPAGREHEAGPGPDPAQRLEKRASGGCPGPEW